MIILSGMTLVTPAVKVTDLIQPVSDLFPGRDFGTTFWTIFLSNLFSVSRHIGDTRQIRASAVKLNFSY